MIVNTSITTAYNNRMHRAYEYELLALNRQWTWESVYVPGTQYPGALCPYNTTWLAVVLHSNNLYYKILTSLNTGWTFDGSWTLVNADIVQTWWSVSLIPGTNPMLVYGREGGTNTQIVTTKYSGSWDTPAVAVDQATIEGLVTGVYGHQDTILFQGASGDIIHAQWSGGTWGNTTWDLRGVWDVSTDELLAPLPYAGLLTDDIIHFYFSAKPMRYGDSGMPEVAGGQRLYACTVANGIFSEAVADALGVLSDFETNVDQRAALLFITKINNIYFGGVTQKVWYPDTSHPNAPAREQPRRNYLIASADGEHWSMPLAYTPSVPFALAQDGDYVYLLGADSDWHVVVHRMPLNVYTGANGTDVYTRRVNEWSLSLPDGGQAAQFTFNVSNPRGIFNTNAFLQNGQGMQLKVGIGASDKVAIITVILDSLSQRTERDQEGVLTNELSISALDYVKLLKQTSFDKVLTIPSQIPQFIDFSTSGAAEFVELAGSWALEGGAYKSLYDATVDVNLSLEAGIARYGLSEFNQFGVRFNQSPLADKIEFAGMMCRVGYASPSDGNTNSITTITRGYAVLVYPQMNGGSWNGNVIIKLREWDDGSWDPPTGGSGTTESGTIAHLASSYIYVRFRTWYARVKVWYSTDGITWVDANIDYIFNPALPQGELGFTTHMGEYAEGEDTQIIYFDNYYNCTVTPDKPIDYLAQEVAAKCGILDIIAYTFVENDFTSAATGWELLVAATQPSVAGGYMLIPNNDLAFYTARPYLGQRYVINWKGQADNGVIAFSARSSAATDVNTGSDYTTAYKLRIIPGSPTTVSLFKAGVLKETYYTDVTLQASTNYHWSLSFNVGWISLWVNGRHLLSYYDVDYQPFTYHYWGFIGEGGQAEVDYVRVPAMYQTFGIMTINPGDSAEVLLTGLVEIAGGKYCFNGNGVLYLMTGNPQKNNAHIWDNTAKQTFIDELLSAAHQQDDESWCSTVRVYGNGGRSWGDAHDDTIAQTRGYRYYQESIDDIKNEKDCETRAAEILAERNRLLVAEDWDGDLYPLLERGDRIRLVNEADGVTADFIITALSLAGELETPSATMSVSTIATDD